MSERTRENLAVYLSVYANTQPSGGVLFVRVENDGAPTGCRMVGHEHLQRIEKIGTYCSDARYETKRIAISNNKGEDDFVLLSDYFIERISWLK